MSVCLLHPHIESSGTCEYCTQPHCAQCLQSFLGRRYCPACLDRVRVVALGPAEAARARARSFSPSAAPVTVPADGGEAVASAPRPRLAGWLSGLLYVIGFLLVQLIGTGMAAAPLLITKQVVGSMASGGGRATGNLFSADDIGLGAWVLLFAVFTWGSFLAVLAYTALMSHLVERRSLADLGLRLRPTMWRDLLVGIALAGVLFVSVAGVGAGANWYTIRPSQLTLQALATPPVGFLLLLPYAALEEVGMRGYLLNAVSRSWGKAVGVIASTLVFAGLHAMNPHFLEHPLAVVGLLLAGLYLASAYLVTGNLWLAIFLHAGWNLMEGPVFGLPVSGMTAPASVFHTTLAPGAPALWTGGSFGPEAGLLVCILLVAHTGVLWALRPVLQAPSAPLPTIETSGGGTYRAIPVGRA